MRFATVSVATVPFKIVDDRDTTTDIQVDVWLPYRYPTVADRVLYDIVGGQVVVINDIDSPMRIYAVTLTMGGTANTLDAQNVALPTGWFPQAPRVLATLGTSNTNPSTVNTEVWASNLTTTGFTANFIRSNTTVCTVRWLAVLD